MILHYIKIAIRHLLRHPATALINLLGLSVGMAVVSLILFHVLGELSYDRFQVNRERLKRVVQIKDMNDGNVDHLAMTPTLDQDALLDAFPQIEAASRIHYTPRRIVFLDGKPEFEDNVINVDPGFLKMFSYPLIAGDLETCLSEPNQIVITRSLARKYFGEVNPVGKTLLLDKPPERLITGIVDDPPEKSHLNFSILESFKTAEADPRWKWISRGHTAVVQYILLSEGVTHEDIEPELSLFYTQQVPDLDIRGLYIQPITDIHLFSGQIRFDYALHKSDSRNVYLLATLAIVILLLACINFMNLATARSMLRAREIGLRKTAGASRWQLFLQFVGESVMIALLSFPLAVLIVELTQRWFIDLAQTTVDSEGFIWSEAFIYIFAITVITGLLSGIYPAIVLSSFQPVKMLNNQLNSIGRSAFLRKLLVTSQFSVSVVFIIGAILMHQQITFMRAQSIGFNHDNVLAIRLQSEQSAKNAQVIQDELMRLPEVQNTCKSMVIPGWGTAFSHIFPDGYTKENPLIINMNMVDENFIETMGLKIIEGVGFDEMQSTDGFGVIINQAALRMFGWDNIEGKTIRREGSEKRLPVLGVYEDYHFQSLHHTIEPQIIYNYPVRSGYLSISIQAGETARTVEKIRNIWETVVPDVPFDYNFLDDFLAEWYKSEEYLERIVGLFTLLSIIIACMGLLGLTIHATQRRTREIGIRKVLGSGVYSLVQLITREFIYLVGISCLISFPLSYYIMNRWLQNFTTRTTLDLWIFLLSGMLAMMLALITVGFHAIRTANADPVKSLRYE